MKKDNIKLGVGVSLLIAALSVSGCSMHNSTSLATNDSTIEATIDNLDEIKKEEEKLQELQNKLDELIEKNNEKISNSNNEKTNEEEKVNNYKNDYKRRVSRDGKRRFIYMPEYTETNNTNPEFTMVDEYFEANGDKWVIVPYGYVLFSLNDDVDINLYKIENGNVMYLFNRGSYLNHDTYFAVREDLYDVVRAANNLNHNLLNMQFDRHIIKPKKQMSQEKIMGIVVPDDFTLIDSTITDNITIDTPLYDSNIVASEDNPDGTLYYMKDGSKIRKYYAIRNELIWFYKWGMSITNNALSEIKKINEENSYKL